MSSRRIDAFFYGLYMHPRVLRDAGAEPANLRRARVKDFGLRLGQRATLVPAPGEHAWGMLVSLTQAELERLYGAPGLEGYRPEAVVAHTDAGEALPALCYNLLQAPEPHERNPEYAMRLRQVLEELGFQAEYIESLGGA